MESFHLERNNDPWSLQPSYEEVHSFKLVMSWQDKYLRNSDYWLIISFSSAGAFLLLWALGQKNIF